VGRAQRRKEREEKMKCFQLHLKFEFEI
jgi:hypothetical protein